MALCDVRIVGVGHFLPGEPVTNKEAIAFANIKSFDEKWAEEKIGIKTRYSARLLPCDPKKPTLRPGCSNSDMCAKAAKMALAMADIEADEIDMIIVATCTPDYPVPATSTYVQEKLGIAEVATMDVRSACCGAFQALTTARQYLLSGTYKTILVCACDVGTMYGDQELNDDSRHKKAQSVNWLLIGDAAGAMVLRGFEPNEKAHGIEIVCSKIKSIGKDKVPGFYMPAGGCINPFTEETLKKGEHFFAHNFREVLEHGPELYYRALQDCISLSGLALDEITTFIPHQANGKIPEFADKFSKTTGVDITNKLYNNFERVGNTANASTYLSLSELVEKQHFQDGDTIALLGAESTKWLYGSIVLRYHPIGKDVDSATRSERKAARRANFTSRVCTGLLMWSVDKYFKARGMVRDLWRWYQGPAPVAGKDE